VVVVLLELLCELPPLVPPVVPFAFDPGWVTVVVVVDVCDELFQGCQMNSAMTAATMMSAMMPNVAADQPLPSSTMMSRLLMLPPLP
jgi:hypothetical protein